MHVFIKLGTCICFLIRTLMKMFENSFFENFPHLANFLKGGGGGIFHRAWRMNSFNLAINYIKDITHGVIWQII